MSVCVCVCIRARLKYAEGFPGKTLDFQALSVVPLRRVKAP